MITMDSRGVLETERLRKNLEKQLDRLVQQLEDIEQDRDTLDSADYNEAIQLTKEDLQELNESLQRMIAGNMTLVDQLGAIQLATQAAICDVFKTPAIIRMFGKREISQLKERFTEIEHGVKLGKLSKSEGDSQRGEILHALRQLGYKLQPHELQLLRKLRSKDYDTTNFVQITDGEEKGEMALAIVGDEVKTQNE